MPPNVRARGKIRHEEWPKIVERFRAGETMAEIARSYGCTPPAIRYIVGRTTAAPAAARAVSPTVVALASAEPAPASRLRSAGPPASEAQPADATSPGNEIWGRINNDIATFLAAVDELFGDETDGNYEALLKATDRLLWASARTRLELERVLAARRAKANRRRASA